MLFEEAKFIGNLMHELNPEDVFPLCNLGSSNEELAKIRQPWIDKVIVGVDSSQHLDRLLKIEKTVHQAFDPLLASDDVNLINPSKWKID